MGKEIVYCEICGDRILEQEFEKGKAVTILNKNYCSKCKEEAVKNITMEDVYDEGVEAGPKKSRSSSMMRAVRSEPPTRTPPKGMSSPHVKTPPVKTAPKSSRPGAAPDKSSRTAMIVGGSIGGVALLLLLVLMLSSNKDEGGKAKEDGNGGGKTTGGGGGVPDKGALARAEKAWNDISNFAGNPQANPDDILTKIKIEEPNVKGTEYEPRLADLKEKMIAKKEEVKIDLEISDLLREVEGIKLSDPDFRRFKEAREKLQSAQKRADPHCRGRLPEISRILEEYVQGYEKAAEAPYQEIYDYASNLAKEGRYGDAVIKIDTYPEHFRESTHWKSLKYLRDEYEGKKKKGGEGENKGGKDGKQGNSGGGGKPDASVKAPTLNQWTDLVGGSSLSGWARMAQTGDKAGNWSVSEGVLRGKSSHDGSGDTILDILASEFDRFGDFELEFEARALRGESLVVLFRVVKQGGEFSITPFDLKLDRGWVQVKASMSGEKLKVTQGGADNSSTFQGIPAAGKLALGLYPGCEVELRNARVRLLK